MTRKVYSLKQTTSINFSQCLRQTRCGKCCIFLAEKNINQQIIPIHIFLLPAPRYSIPQLITFAYLGAFFVDGRQCTQVVKGRGCNPPIVSANLTTVSN